MSFQTISPLRLTPLLCLLSVTASAADCQWSFDDVADRVWVGPDFWANRLHDWRVADGRIECIADQPRLPMRTLSLLTYELNDGDGSFEISVCCGLLSDDPAGVSDSAACGFLIGTAPDIDYRARALIHGASGPGAGTFFGVTARGGESFFVDNTRPWTGSPKKAGASATVGPSAPIERLRLTGAPAEDGMYSVTLNVDYAQIERDPKTTVKQSSIIGRKFSPEQIRGGIALVSHPGDPQASKYGGRWWFDDLKVSGDKISVDPNRRLGPIVSTQYTIDTEAGDPALMKLTAQLTPLGEREPHAAALQVQKPDGSWKSVAEADVTIPGWTATFRDDKWDASIEEPYRVIYPATSENGGRPSPARHEWHGTFRKDPADKETIVVAGFTGNHNNAHGFARPGYDYTQNIWFPHAAITRGVAYHQPDLLFFSGDQVYEGDSPTFADSDPVTIKLDYLYKWYLWCWAYRDLTKDIPAIVEPDDHDVYQGNLWGQGGRKAVSPPGDRYNNGVARDHDGGYLHPADFVQMVERTQTSHLPDPYDPQLLEQGITSYYTDLVWGKIGVAILEDRKFKSGCNRPDMPPSGTGRPDHFNDPNFNIADLDKPGLSLLGENQEAFLNAFAGDWEGQEMKMAVSQTIFANMATHHGGGLERLIADLDSNGWPQSGRNRAMEALRKGHMFHLAGDQHLATIVHHGIKEHGDAIWSFCVPSVANFYPRAWAPKDKGEYTNPPPEDYTGDFYDGFGHPVTVYASTNPPASGGRQSPGGVGSGPPGGGVSSAADGPEQSTSIEPVKLHNGMPGYGIVRLNKRDQTITMECWPRSTDPSDPDAKQYTGWPMTISVEGNSVR